MQSADMPASSNVKVEVMQCIVSHRVQKPAIGMAHDQESYAAAPTPAARNCVDLMSPQLPRAASCVEAQSYDRISMSVIVSIRTG